MVRSVGDGAIGRDGRGGRREVRVWRVIEVGSIGKLRWSYGRERRCLIGAN